MQFNRPDNLPSDLIPCEVWRWKWETPNYTGHNRFGFAMYYMPEMWVQAKSRATGAIWYGRIVDTAIRHAERARNTTRIVRTRGDRFLVLQPDKSLGSVEPPDEDFDEIALAAFDTMEAMLQEGDTETIDDWLEFVQAVSRLC